MLVENDDLNDFEGGLSLDLNYGHLTVDHGYVPLNEFNFCELKNWYQPADGYASSDCDYVARIQPFKNGGYETTLKVMDMQSMGRLLGSPPPTKGKKREKHDNVKQEDRLSSAKRAKKKARQLIKSMGCDRLMTLTRREIDPDFFWTDDDWQKAWDKFCRLLKKAGIDLAYVATLEKHKKGNLHLHAAINAKVPINTIRGIWWAICGGKGMGNVDISFKQGMSEYQRRSGVAKYVSKYIVKQMENFDFNKKRYWASRHTLEAVQRIILKSKDLGSALVELVEILGLDLAAVQESIFTFDANLGKGAWFDYDSKMQKEVPF